MWSLGLLCRSCVLARPWASEDARPTRRNQVHATKCRRTQRFSRLAFFSWLGDNGGREVESIPMSNELGIYCLARLAAGVLLLWLTASAAFSLLFGIVHADPLAFLLYFPLLASIAVPCAGVQIILYSMLMEFCVWRVVGTNVLAIFVSSLLGLACGLSIYLLTVRDFLSPLMFSGFAAGLTTGLILRCLKRRGLAERVPSHPVGAIT